MRKQGQGQRVSISNPEHGLACHRSSAVEGQATCYRVPSPIRTHLISAPLTLASAVRPVIAAAAWHSGVVFIIIIVTMCTAGLFLKVHHTLHAL